MKRCLVFLLLLCLVLPVAQGVEDLILDPASLAQYNGMEVTGFVQPGGGDWAFLALWYQRMNFLVGLKKETGGWRQAFINLAAFPHGDMQIRLTDLTGTGKNVITGQEIRFEAGRYGPAFASYWSNGEYFEDHCVFEQDANGVFQLVNYARAGQSGMVDLSPTHMVFHDAFEQFTWVAYTLNRSAQGFSLERLPKNPRQAQQPGDLPPQLSESWLSAREIPLLGQDLIPVYSAPSDTSLRLASGKAAVSPRGWALVFGTEGDYALILYGIAPRHFRAGYIKTSFIPEGWDLAPLNFTPTPAQVIRKTTCLDGFNTLSQDLTNLTPGQPVTLLSRMGDFAYFEASLKGQTYRALAPLSAFDREPQPPKGKVLTEFRTAWGLEQALLSPFEQSGYPKLWYDARRFTPYQYIPELLRFDLAGSNPFEGEISLTIAPVSPHTQLDDLKPEYQGYTITPTSHQNILPGFIAAREDQRIETYLKDSPLGRYRFTLTYPERAQDTWRFRLLNILDNAEMGGF